ncbi:hypothetical protein E2C01_043284 [Portunus trituberculatus]|nr:hypothetical protein [Portunus trituberculatus]
MAVRKS